MEVSKAIPPKPKQRIYIHEDEPDGVTTWFWHCPSCGHFRERITRDTAFLMASRHECGISRSQPQALKWWEDRDFEWWAGTTAAVVIGLLLILALVWGFTHPEQLSELFSGTPA